MDKIEHNGELIAIRVSEFASGSNPITDAKEPLQVMTLKRNGGEKVAPHLHIPHTRTTDRLQECLVVRKGSARVDFYGKDKQVFKSVTIKTGDVLIILSGGHALEYLESTEIVELKNGPYVDDKTFI